MSFSWTSGAGKTSILKMILRQIALPNGIITADGQTISDKSLKIHKNPRQSIGVVFQGFQNFTDKIYLKNVAISLRIRYSSFKK